MRLGFDATSLTHGGKGLARLQAELLREFAVLGLVDDMVVFVSAEADESRLPRAPGWRYVTVRATPMVVWEQLGLPRVARREMIDAVITTSERAALFGPPRVVYIFEHPRHRAARDRETGASLRQRLVNAVTLALFPLSMRRAASVLVASQATAEDLRPIRPVEVVYPGVAPEFGEDEDRGRSIRARMDAPAGYFLHIASDDPRENSETVLHALAELAAAGERPPLVIGGSPRRRAAGLRALAQQLGVTEQLRWAGFQEGADLADLYRGAAAYVDPSFYEGFGLQALEALACGTPVIASNRTSLPEVVGDAGILLDPLDAPGFADAMHRVLGDPDLVADLRARARAQASRFTWERTARATLAACGRAA